MFKYLRTLLAPEWFGLLSPRELLYKILVDIYILLEPYITYSADLKSTYNRLKLKGQTILTIVDPIIVDTQEQGTTKKFRYKIELPKDIYIVGNGLASHTGIKGLDFISVDKVYWFKEHPSRYAQVLRDTADVYMMPVVSSVNDVSFQVLTKDEPADNAVVKGLEALTDETNPLGMSAYLLDSQRGCFISRYVGERVDKRWVEGSTVFAITTGGVMVWADINGPYVITDVITRKSDAPSYITVPLFDKFCVAALGYNRLDSYDNILQAYPELAVIGGEYFIGYELLNILKQRGCIFDNIIYIKSLNKRDVSVIAKGTAYINNVFRIQVTKSDTAIGITLPDALITTTQYT